MSVFAPSSSCARPPKIWKNHMLVRLVLEFSTFQKVVAVNSFQKFSCFHPPFGAAAKGPRLVPRLCKVQSAQLAMKRPAEEMKRPAEEMDSEAGFW